jgi:hypothetical protein
MAVAKSVLCLLAALPCTAFAAGSQALLEQVQADHAALTAAESDFELRGQRGELGVAAASEYAAYLQGLRARLAADCLALLQTGEAAPAGVPCPELAVRSRGGAALNTPLPPSRAEQTGILDTEFEAGLAEFDELLLREQRRVKAAAPRAATSGGQGGAEGLAAGEAAGAGGTTQPGSAATAETGQQERAGATPPGAGEGARTAARGGEAAAEVPGGSDDDVVARQLREAAEQETDPELKEKLWEEYRRYKRGIR